MKMMTKLVVGAAAFVAMATPAMAVYPVQDDMAIVQIIAQLNEARTQGAELLNQGKDIKDTLETGKSLYKTFGEGKAIMSGNFGWFGLAKRGMGVAKACGLDATLPTFDFDFPKLPDFKLPSIDFGCLGNVAKAVEPAFYGIAKSADGSSVKLDWAGAQTIRSNREKAYQGAIKNTLALGMFNRQLAGQSGDLLEEVRRRSESTQSVAELMQIQISATLMVVDELQKLRTLLASEAEMNAAEKVRLSPISGDAAASAVPQQ